MSDYEIGYGKPPKHSQFRKGVCPNLRGRGKHQDLQIGEIVQSVLHTKIEFRESGKIKKASRIELLVKKLVAAAIKGDVGSADLLLRIRSHAIKSGDSGPLIIKITGGLQVRGNDRSLPQPRSGCD